MDEIPANLMTYESAVKTEPDAFGIQRISTEKSEQCREGVEVQILILFTKTIYVKQTSLSFCHVGGDPLPLSPTTCTRTHYVSACCRSARAAVNGTATACRSPSRLEPRHIRKATAILDRRQNLRHPSFDEVVNPLRMEKRDTLLDNTIRGAASPTLSPSRDSISNPYICAKPCHSSRRDSPSLNRSLSRLEIRHMESDLYSSSRWQDLRNPPSFDENVASSNPLELTQKYRVPRAAGATITGFSLDVDFLDLKAARLCQAVSLFAEGFSMQVVVAQSQRFPPPAAVLASALYCRSDLGGQDALAATHTVTSPPSPYACDHPQW
ncbi:hypothetical protein GGX14DRAFT_566909 [Mycena pura]|uniref:Uncharacterized protein n=1 Tax=Mycena pura TaxID=153505 RepID=A0AAD6VF88_9AGAR|nr:hypothetical protein GGX14DRAFT_566909 [Mycena pura]